MMIAFAESSPIIRISMTGRRESREILRDSVVLIRAAIASFARALESSMGELVEIARQSFARRAVTLWPMPEALWLPRAAEIAEILAASRIAGKLRTRKNALEAGGDLELAFAETFPRSTPPTKAIDWIKNLRVVSAEAWKAMVESQRAPAFFITGIEQREILRTIQRAIAESLERGETLRDFEVNVRERIRNLQLTGGRLRNVWHNNVSNALRKGRYDELQEPEIKSVLGYFLFDAIVDSVVRPNHAALEGGIAPVDWPGWQEYRDPLGFNCRCQRIAITPGRARRMLESGQGWDLTAGAPLEAGMDPGYTRLV